LNLISNLETLLESALSENPPLSKRDANIFKDGYDKSVDEYRKLLYQGKDYILNLQKQEIEKTGIANLKINFNKVFGYYIEVSNSKTDLVPDYFIRKQTLANSERYITPELKEYEEKILNAEDRIHQIELQLWEDYLNVLADSILPVQQDAQQVAEWDVLVGFAAVSVKRNYHKPDVSDSHVLHLKQCRHPVIVALIPPDQTYVPNDIF
jgi:DNA mismatch repair protein MutS